MARDNAVRDARAVVVRATTLPRLGSPARHWYAKAAARGSVEGRYTLHLLRHDKSVF